MPRNTFLTFLAHQREIEEQLKEPSFPIGAEEFSQEMAERFGKPKKRRTPKRVQSDDPKLPQTQRFVLAFLIEHEEIYSVSYSHLIPTYRMLEDMETQGLIKQFPGVEWLGSSCGHIWKITTLGRGKADLSVIRSSQYQRWLKKHEEVEIAYHKYEEFAAIHLEKL